MASAWLDPALPEALTMALNDEYRAHARYQAVIARYGPVSPFIHILGAEQRHIEALIGLFRRYGIPIPNDSWTGNLTTPDTLQAACEAGIAGEIANYRMYDRLLEQIAEPDVRHVFINLRNASAYRHLPAFQRCAAVGMQPPTATCQEDSESLKTMLSVGLGVLVGAGLVWYLSRQAHSGER